MKKFNKTKLFKDKLNESREYLKKLINEQNPEEDLDGDTNTGGTYDPDMYSFNDPEWEFGDDVDWWDDDDYNINNPNAGGNLGQCEAYGCMDPEAINYNPAAGPYYYCELGCFYDNSDMFNDNWAQDLAIEQEECIIQGLNPCIVYDQGLGQPASVYCCHPQQQCMTPGGCIGMVLGGDSNDNIDNGFIDDLQNSFCADNPSQIGCRHSNFANYCPSCQCDCTGTFMGAASNGPGNTSCCSMTDPDQIGAIDMDGGRITGHEHCFTPESLVTMSNGEEKPISKVEVGDLVKSEHGNSQVIGIDIHKGEFEVYSINGKKAFVTEEHPFKTINGWKAINPTDTLRKHQVESSLLKEGDTLITINGEEEIKSIEKTDSSDVVYNLRLDNEHVYYTNGYLVHNGKNVTQELIVCPGVPGNPELTKHECERKTKEHNQQVVLKKKTQKTTKNKKVKGLREQDPDDTNDDWDLTDDVVLDDVVVTDTYDFWDQTNLPSNYIDQIDINYNNDLPDWDPQEPINPNLECACWDGSYDVSCCTGGNFAVLYDFECEAYGCMNPNAYNYNSNAGPHPWCSTFCHYGGPQSFNQQNYANEAAHCNAMSTELGVNFLPCYTQQGFSYNTIPDQPEGTTYYGNIGQTGWDDSGTGTAINNYQVQCCGPGQSCHTSAGCIGEINPQLIPGIDLPDSIADDDIPDEFQECNAENSGCRAPQFANFSPDHICDCSSIYFGPAGQMPFGNVGCCNNNAIEFLPTNCIDQLYDSLQAIEMDNYNGVIWDSSCWEGINPNWTINDLRYYVELQHGHPGLSEPDGDFHDSPCFYGCTDPLAGNYDPNANCSDFPQCSSHPDCGNCEYFTTSPEQDVERPEKPEVSLIRPEKPGVSDVKKDKKLKESIRRILGKL